MLLNFVNPGVKSSKAKPGVSTLSMVTAAILTASAAMGAYYVYHRATSASDSQMAMADRMVRVTPRRLDITITQTGELQAVVNIDLASKVEGRTTIVDIVKEGSYVTKDQVLVQLDSSAIRQQIDDITLELQRAEAAVANARELLAIQQSNNAAELEGAQVTLQLADVDMKKYVEGTYPQEEKTAATKLEMAKIDLQNKQNDLAQSKSLFSRGFVTSTEVTTKELAVTQARNAVEEGETALRVLREYSHQADLAAKKNALAQARSKLERVKRQNESMIVQRTADLNAAEQQLSLRKRKLQEAMDQEAACTIRAPDDGMVVYSNDQDRQTIIQEGAEVRERQPILRLPDTRQMKAVLKLNEAQANRVQVGMRANIEITGISLPVTGTVSKVSIVPLSGNRWINPDAKDYPAEVTLDITPANLKPSTTARTTIMLRSIPDALAVPLEAIYSSGQTAYVFAGDGNGNVIPREIKLGESSLTHAQVVNGLSSGDSVLILEAGQGKRLLDEAGIKMPDPSTQPAGESRRRRDPNSGGNAPANTAAPNAAARNGERQDPAGNRDAQATSDTAVKADEATADTLVEDKPTATIGNDKPEAAPPATRPAIAE